MRLCISNNKIVTLDESTHIQKLSTDNLDGILFYHCHCSVLVPLQCDWETLTDLYRQGARDRYLAFRMTHNHLYEAFYFTNLLMPNMTC